MTVQEIFQAAAAIEGMTQELYDRLAERFHDDPVLRDLFSELAREEAQHALRIRLLGRQAAREPWRYRIDEQAQVNVASMAVEVAAMADELISDGYHGDVAALLLRIGDMERRLSVLHADELARDADPEARSIFRLLAQQDSHHLAMLEDVARTHSGQTG